MDVFQLLKSDHKKVSGLFKKIAATTDRAVKTRRTLRTQLKNELELHASAEEAHFYPMLENHPETKKFVGEALKEHNGVKKVLTEIGRMPVETGEFLTKAKELERMVQHHVKEEESEIFPAARAAMGDEEIEAALERIQSMKRGGMRSAAE
jgi:hemerythrin superfamily protein